MTSLRLSKELETRLTHLAKTTGRTKTFYIRKLIEEHIDDLEDRYIGEEQEQIENSYKRFTSKEMRRKLGLED